MPQDEDYVTRDMTGKCLVCLHEKREEIDVKIIEGITSLKSIGKEYEISETTIKRHSMHMKHWRRIYKYNKVRRVSVAAFLIKALKIMDEIEFIDERRIERAVTELNREEYLILSKHKED